MGGWRPIMNDILLHGGASDLMKRRYPDAPQPWLDLSTGINPWPYVPQHASTVALTRLPTSEQFAKCSAAMAAALHVPADSLLLAPGSEILIRLLPTILQAEKVCVAADSYGDHAKVWQNTDCELTVARDPLLEADSCDVVVVCNPNNPDGRTWATERLSLVRRSLLSRDGTLIIDEAYADLCPEMSLAGEAGKGGLIVLRSFGKFFGLGGVRLGAMVAAPPLLDAMRERLGVWPVAGPTLEIGAAAYRDLEWQDGTRRQLAARRKALDDVLIGNGISIKGGTDLYRFVGVRDAHTVWHRLASHGIYVRKFEWCDRSLRIGMPASGADLSRLDESLGKISL